MSAEICSCAPDCEERILCQKVGEVGHWQCGRCDVHSAPRHLCGCLAIASGGDA